MDVQKPQAVKYSGFGLIACMVLAAIIWNCATSDPSNEKFKGGNLNPCTTGMAENQKAIQKIQAQEKSLYENMNDSNKKDISAQIANLEDQIKGINASNATQMENCGPIGSENSVP